MRRRHERKKRGGRDGDACRQPLRAKALEQAAPEPRPHERRQHDRTQNGERTGGTIQHRAQVVERRGRAENGRREGGRQALGLFTKRHPPLGVDLRRAQVDRLPIGQGGAQLRSEDKTERQHQQHRGGGHDN